jgi:energy-coupling factor transport system permease protein
MFQKIPVILGQYRPLNSYLHKLDARAKILPICIVLILSLLTDSTLFYLSILALLIISLFLSGIDRKTIWSNFKPILILVVVTSLYHLIFSSTDNSKVLLNIFGWKITQTAVASALFYSLRLVIFISIAFVMTLTSSPSDLGEAFFKLLRPLEKIKLPVNDLALILFIALRFIPILYEEFTAIKNAQIIRGVNFKGSLLNRINKTTSIIIPLFVAATQRADELALALQARGYTGGNDRSFYTNAIFGYREIIFSIMSIVIIGSIYFLIG